MARVYYDEDDEEAHGRVVKIEPPRARRGMIRNPPPPRRPPRSPSMYCDDTVAPGTRAEVMAAGKCAFCGATNELTIDHVVPRSKGGGSHRENLQCLCGPCNRWKDSEIMSAEQYRKLPSKKRKYLARIRREYHLRAKYNTNLTIKPKA